MNNNMVTALRNKEHALNATDDYNSVLNDLDELQGFLEDLRSNLPNETNITSFNITENNCNNITVVINFTDVNGTTTSNTTN